MHFSSLAALVLTLGCAQAATISKDAQCGSSVGGATCLGSSFGNCCSVNGWCGATSDYCATGCQSAYGTCGSSTSSTSKSSAAPVKSSAAPSKSSAAPSSSSSQKVSPDATCGGANGYTCQGTSFGSCCSSNGWCGATSDYCGTGCQSKFGTCNTISSTPSSSVKPVSSVSPSSSAKISSASIKPSSASVKPSSTAKASSVTVHRPISTDATCGDGSNGATCRGSVFGNCCSSSGYCGSTDDYCTNCQASYGNCGAGTGSLKYPLTIPSAGTIPSGTQCGVTGDITGTTYETVNVDDQACAILCKNDSKCKSFVYWYFVDFYIGTPYDKCYLSNQTVSANRGTDSYWYTFYDKACAVPAPVPADPVVSSIGPYCEFNGRLNGATEYKTFSGTPIAGSPFYQMALESDCKSQCSADANCQSTRYVSYPSQSGHPSGTCYFYNTTAHSPSDLTYRPDTVDIFNDKSCS